MKFLIVDDHAVVRRGVRQLLADEYPQAAFSEASNVADALQHVIKEPWDLLLLDVTLPGRSGIEAIAEFRKARPGLAVIILSMHPESEFAVRAIKAGASGYVTKQSADEELLAAVRKVLAGGRYITAALAEQLADTVTGVQRSGLHENLSDREFQVLRLLARGQAVKEIAASLSLSAKTVSTYRVRILEKLALKSTVDLARYALQHGLVE